MTLNDVMTLILRYFTEFGSVRDALRKSGWTYTKTFCNSNVAQGMQFLAIFTYGDMMYGTVPSAGLNARGLAKYSDFGPIECYISATVQYMRQVSIIH